MLKILDKVCNKLENWRSVNKESLSFIVEFIRTFLLICAYQKICRRNY